MKRLAIALASILVASPAMAGHNRVRMGEFEVVPTHCVYDRLYEEWNCWYGKPSRRKHSVYHHHHHHHHERDIPVFRPNKHNEHGVPCYSYKKGPWCI